MLFQVIFQIWHDVTRMCGLNSLNFNGQCSLNPVYLIKFKGFFSILWNGALIDPKSLWEVGHGKIIIGGNFLDLYQSIVILNFFLSFKNYLD